MSGTAALIFSDVPVSLAAKPAPTKYWLRCSKRYFFSTSFECQGQAPILLANCFKSLNQNGLSLFLSQIKIFSPAKKIINLECPASYRVEFRFTINRPDGTGRNPNSGTAAALLKHRRGRALEGIRPPDPALDCQRNHQYRAPMETTCAKPGG